MIQQKQLGIIDSSFKVDANITTVTKYFITMGSVLLSFVSFPWSLSKFDKTMMIPNLIYVTL